MSHTITHKDRLAPVTRRKLDFQANKSEQMARPFQVPVPYVLYLGSAGFRGELTCGPSTPADAPGAEATGASPHHRIRGTTSVRAATAPVSRIAVITSRRAATSTDRTASSSAQAVLAHRVMRSSISMLIR